MGLIPGNVESGFWLAGAGCGGGALAWVVARRVVVCRAWGLVGVGSVSGRLVVGLEADKAPGSGFMGSIRESVESGFLRVFGFKGSILGIVESGVWPVAAGCGCRPGRGTRRPALR